MKTYRAVAKREDGWWIISVPELDVVTQARRIDQIEHMARDLIAAWLEVDYDEVAVTVDLRIPREWSAEAEIVRRAQEVAALANAEAVDQCHCDGCPEDSEHAEALDNRGLEPLGRLGESSRWLD